MILLCFDVLIIVLFFVLLVLYECWFPEMVKKSSEFDDIFSLTWSYRKRQLLNVQTSFIFIIFKLLNEGFTGSLLIYCFHLLRSKRVFQRRQDISGKRYQWYQSLKDTDTIWFNLGSMCSIHFTCGKVWGLSTNIQHDCVSSTQ